MISPLTFVACFMFLTMLLLIGVVYSRIHWLLKAGLVVISLGFSVFFYQAHVNALGYPVAAQPPPMFRFLYSVVREPAKNDPGVIYVWLFEKGAADPRVIALPYSTEARKMMNAANKKVGKGDMVFMGKRGEGQEGQDGKEGKPGEGQQGKGRKSNSAEQQHGQGDNQLPYNVHGNALEFKAPPDTVPKKATE